MKRILEDRRIEIRTSALILFSVFLLTVPFRWLFAVIFSSAVHEMAHLAAINLYGKQISYIRFGVFGAEIYIDLSTGWEELLCLLAGPAGSLLLLFVFRWFPLIAIFGGIQGLFNLLPVLPLDGGRILRCILIMLFSEKMAGTILERIAFFVYVCLFLLCYLGTLVLKLSI